MDKPTEVTESRLKSMELHETGTTKTGGLSGDGGRSL